MAKWLSGALVLDDARYRVQEQGREVRLTRSEFRVLRLLLWVNGRVVSYRVLLERGCGWRDGTPATNTVSVHACSLRKKLAACRRHLATVAGIGLRYDGPIRYEEEVPHDQTHPLLRVLAGAVGRDRAGADDLRVGPQCGDRPAPL